TASTTTDRSTEVVTTVNTYVTASGEVSTTTANVNGSEKDSIGKKNTISHGKLLYD
ncbi:hypothetical protein LSAT2_014271, partial [Lamellibrachia satsuma]